MSQENIIILGGGPAGLASAYKLSQAGKKLTLIEKDKNVGGLARTLEFPEADLIFKTDIGPHRFFSQNPKLYELIADLLKDDWVLVKRQTRQFIDGKFYDYPINAWQAFGNIGLIKACYFVLSYFKAQITYKIFRKKVNSFEDYIIANFGKQLGEFNMLNYSAKIWGVPCSQLHADWAKQRIKGLNFISALKNALFNGSKNKPKTLVDNFYYPRHGTGQIYNTLAQKITQTGNQILTETYPIKILHHENKITKIICQQNQQQIEFEPQQLINSIPITEFLKLLDPAPDQAVMTAANNLKWRDQIYLFITLDKDQITPDNWIYFPNLNIPFARIAEMKNFIPTMSPPGKTSLFVEFFVSTNEKLWQASDQEIFALANEQLLKLGLYSANEIRQYYVLKKQKTYPIYDLDYKDNLKIITDYLNQFNNLQYIGRPGRFQYTNQDHSLEMGLLAADNIINNINDNLSTIGQTNEYFEQGSIKKTCS